MANRVLVCAAYAVALFRSASASAGASCTVDVGTPYASSIITSADEYTKKIRNIYGVMNAPVPVPIKDDKYAGFVYDDAQYLQSFKKLGTSTVRFNDLGPSALMSITQIFTAFPRSDAALTNADIAALAGDLDNYDFSGVDKFMGGAVKAGQDINFRFGDGWTTANALNKGQEVRPGVLFPAAWKFPVNYTSSKGREMYAAVLAEQAAHAYKMLPQGQTIYFDFLTETANQEECVFWPGTAEEYASLYSVVMLAVQKRIGKHNNVKYIAANSAFGKSFGKKLSSKRVFFQDVLKALEQCGQAACPVDAIAFHPFTNDPADYVEMMQFAYRSVQEIMQSYSPMPSFAVTAWAQHGSGMFDINDNVAGAASMASLLVAFQDFPIEFAIYYKYAGWNIQQPWNPSLALIDGQLKPNAFPFMMMKEMSEVGMNRVSSSCTNGNTIIAAIGSTASHFSALMAGTAAITTTLEVPHCPCVGKASTLTVEELKQVEDAACTKESQSKPCIKGWVSTSTVSGSVHGDGLFYKKGGSGVYQLSLGAATDAYVARIELECTQLEVVV